MRNISPWGVFVSTQEPPPLGARVRFRVFFNLLHPRSRLVMKTTAHIVRVEPSPQGGVPAGFALAVKDYTLRNEKEFLERKV